MSENSTNLGSMPTTDLLPLARGGRMEAVDALWKRYGPRIVSIVRIRLGAKLRGLMESTDIRQQVLLDVFDRLEDFEMRDDSSLMRWLARHIENAIRTEAKYHSASKRDADLLVPMPAVDNGDEEKVPIDPPGFLSTPSVEVGRAERADAVRSAIAELPERYREVILLRDYAQTPWEEVGREMNGLTATAARVLYSRAIAKLGKFLRERGID